MAVKRYDGSAWQVVAGKGDQGTSSSISTWVKTASGGETSLSGNDDNSQSLSYTVGQELVFINGTLLKRGSDYTATNGTSITGLTALAANDVATVWTVNAFSVTGAIANTIVDAKGDLLVGTAADTPGRLAVGTNDYVLTADSTTGTGLKWAAPSTGALVYITGATLTNASSWNFPDNTFTSTYRNYMIIMEGRDASNNDAIYWFFRAGGTNNSSGNVKFAVDGLTFDNGTFTQTGTANTYFLAGYPNASGGAYTLTVYAPQVATYTQVAGVASGTSNATSQGGHTSFSAFVNATTQYDAMGFTMSANSYTGTYRVYGIKDS